MKILALMCAGLLAGCAMVDGLPSFEVVPEKVAEAPKASEAPKVQAFVQRKLPAVCEPVAADVAKIHKVEGDKTPQEAVDAAFGENARRLTGRAYERRQCWCWQVAEGMVEVDPKKADKACKGIKLPKVG